MMLTVHLPEQEMKARYLQFPSDIISSSIFPVFPHIHSLSSAQ